MLSFHVAIKSIYILSLSMEARKRIERKRKMKKEKKWK